MANQSMKRGVRSDSQKRDNSRYEDNPAPNSAPVAGAFGHDGSHEQDRPTYDRESARSER